MTAHLRIALTLCCLLCLGAAQAGEGDFDTRFSVDGKQTVGIDLAAPLTDQGAAAFETNDGGMWIVGTASDGSSPTDAVAVSRLSSSGAPSFNRVIPLEAYRVITAAPAPGGSFVVFGDALNGGVRDQFVLKVLSDGNLDPSFSGDGVAWAGASGGRMLGGGVEPDGTVDFLYLSNVNSGRRTLKRFTPTGALQATVVYDTADTPSESAIAVQKDGKVVVAIGREGASCTLQLSRYLPAAQAATLTFDPTFSSPLTTIGSAGCGAYVRDLAFDAAGSITTRYTPSVDEGHRLVRFFATGARDMSFAGSGTVNIPAIVFDFMADITAQPDGSVLTAGTTTVFGRIEFKLCRLTPAGAGDQTFGANFPCVNFPFEGPSSALSTFNTPSSVVVTRSGRILVAGTMLWASPSDKDFAVARLIGTDRYFIGGFE